HKNNAKKTKIWADIDTALGLDSKIGFSLDSILNGAFISRWSVAAQVPGSPYNFLPEKKSAERRDLIWICRRGEADQRGALRRSPIPGRSRSHSPSFEQLDH